MRRTRNVVRMRRGLALAGLLVAATVVVSGCAGIPRSGPVQRGQVVETDGESEIVYKPASPQQGASPEQILRGFIEAASSPASNYAVAREFLAPGIDDDWNPDAGVTVDQQARRSFAETGETTMSLTVIPMAEVDAEGLYSESASADPITQSYGFVQVKGEWRIAEAPDGVILDPVIFEDVFKSYSLSFFDPTMTYLVPDLRWFPSRASTGTRIVSALLDGPSEWLSLAVTTAFPEGTALTKSAVPVENGQAVVDLNREALQADAVTLQRMQAQLASSLVGVPTINSVSITIDGNSTPIEALPIVSPRVDSRALVLTEKGFGFLGVGGELEGIPGISAPVAALAPTAAVLSPDHALAAVKAADGVYAVRSGSDPVLVDPRGGLVAPTLDDNGYLWSVPAASPSQLIAFTAGGDQVPVITSWPEASSVVSIALSRDGTRIAALLTVGSETLFLIAGVERGDNGAPVRLGDPVELAVGGGEPLSATWVDDLTVASLTRGADGATQLIRQVIGGQSDAVTPLADAVEIVGGNSFQQLRALTSSGDLALRRPTAWQTTASGVLFIATQLGSPG